MIRSLISYPRAMSARAILATLVEKMRMDTEAEKYREYVTICLRILTENTSPPAAYYSSGEIGSQMSVDFADIVSGKAKPKAQPKPGEAKAGIMAKLREG